MIVHDVQWLYVRPSVRSSMPLWIICMAYFAYDTAIESIFGMHVYEFILRSVH